MQAGYARVARLQGWKGRRQMISRIGPPEWTSAVPPTPRRILILDVDLLDQRFQILRQFKCPDPNLATGHDMPCQPGTRFRASAFRTSAGTVVRPLVVSLDSAIAIPNSTIQLGIPVRVSAVNAVVIGQWLKRRKPAAAPLHDGIDQQVLANGADLGEDRGMVSTAETEPADYFGSVCSCRTARRDGIAPPRFLHQLAANRLRPAAVSAKVPSS